MRIAHINWILGTGGIETMVADIISEQVKTNEVALFIINDDVEDYILKKIDKRVQVYLLGRKPGSKNPWPIIKLNLLLAKFHPDIIHTHSYKCINVIFYPFSKFVRTIHNTGNIASEYPKFDKLISISKAVKEVTAKQGFDSIEIDNGIVVKKINYKPVGLFKDKKLHFVQVSRLNISQKGQDILIKALANLIRKYKIDNFIMHFIGDGDDLEILKDLTTKLHLSDNVIFEGQKDQSWIYQHLCEYDLFIQPSRYEGFGLTVAEAMAAKIPVLVSNIEGPLEVIDGGKYGMTFISEDSEDCALQLKNFIDKGENHDIVEAAYKHVAENYDVSITAKKYLEVYHSLLSKK